MALVCSYTSHEIVKTPAEKRWNNFWYWCTCSVEKLRRWRNMDNNYQHVSQYKDRFGIWHGHIYKHGYMLCNAVIQDGGLKWVADMRPVITENHQWYAMTWSEQCHWRKSSEDMHSASRNAIQTNHQVWSWTSKSSDLKYTATMKRKYNYAVQYRCTTTIHPVYNCSKKILENLLPVWLLVRTILLIPSRFWSTDTKTASCCEHYVASCGKKNI